MTTSRTRQQRPGFFEGVLVALIASVVISIGVGVFDWLLPAGLLARVLISVAGFAYLVYLFSRSPEKIGRMTALSVYVVMAVANMVFFTGPAMGRYCTPGTDLADPFAVFLQQRVIRIAGPGTDRSERSRCHRGLSAYRQSVPVTVEPVPGTGAVRLDTGQLAAPVIRADNETQTRSF